MSNTELRDANAELQNLKISKTMSRRSSSDKKLEDNIKEISELNSRLIKFNDRMEEEYQKMERKMTDLRNQLAEVIDERDKLVAQVHAFKQKEMQRRSVRSASMSSAVSSAFSVDMDGMNERLLIKGGDVMVPERKTTIVDAQIEELRFELEEERAISQATQENLEEQMRVNRQLEVELDQLKLATPQVLSFRRRRHCCVTYAHDVTSAIFSFWTVSQSTPIRTARSTSSRRHASAGHHQCRPISNSRHTCKEKLVSSTTELPGDVCESDDVLL